MIPANTAFGSSVGVIQVLLTKSQDQVIVPQLPAPWGNLSVLPNILIGSILVAMGYTGRLDKNRYKDFLVPYSFVTLIGGIVNGLTTTILSARPRYGVALASSYASQMAGYGPQPYTGEHLGYQNHMAKGFGAPYANPASTIPYNTVVF